MSAPARHPVSASPRTAYELLAKLTEQGIEIYPTEGNLLRWRSTRPGVTLSATLANELKTKRREVLAILGVKLPPNACKDCRTAPAAWLPLVAPGQFLCANCYAFWGESTPKKFTAPRPHWLRLGVCSLCKQDSIRTSESGVKVCNTCHPAPGTAQ